jgi:hypothetical protein
MPSLVAAGQYVSGEHLATLLRFFRFYAKRKGLLNAWRSRPGGNACEGWCTARVAFARARLRDDAWRGPPIEFQRAHCRGWVSYLTAEWLLELAKAAWGDEPFFTVVAQDLSE